MPDPRVVLEKDAATHIARITLNQPEKKNCYDRPMRRAIAEAMHDIANDDDMKVLLLRGAESIFCTGADMQNAYSWYETKGDDRRPSQRRKIAVDRESFSFYHDYIGFPKATVAQVESYALGGGFELALASDISVASPETRVGMPGARFLGPAIGNLHLVLPSPRAGARQAPAPHGGNHARRRPSAAGRLHGDRPAGASRSSAPRSTPPRSPECRPMGS